MSKDMARAKRGIVNCFFFKLLEMMTKFFVIRFVDVGMNGSIAVTERRMAIPNFFSNKTLHFFSA